MTPSPLPRRDDHDSISADGDHLGRMLSYIHRMQGLQLFVLLVIMILLAWKL